MPATTRTPAGTIVRVEFWRSEFGSWNFRLLNAAGQRLLESIGNEDFDLAAECARRYVEQIEDGNCIVI